MNSVIGLLPTVLRSGTLMSFLGRWERNRYPNGMCSAVANFCAFLKSGRDFSASH